MSMKDDPLRQRPGYRTDAVTLWLDKEGMEEARDNYWQAFNENFSPGPMGLRRETWDIAFAAAVAAFSFLMEGRIKPK